MLSFLPHHRPTSNICVNAHTSCRFGQQTSDCLSIADFVLESIFDVMMSTVSKQLTDEMLFTETVYDMIHRSCDDDLMQFGVLSDRDIC